MNLSGWARLWIVASVIWWGAGAWWLSQNFEPDTVVVKEAVYPPPPPSVDTTRLMKEMQERADQRYLDAQAGNYPKPPTAEDIKRLNDLPASAPQRRSWLDAGFPLEPAVTKDD